MNLVLETLDTNASLDSQQTAIRQTEELGYELLSLASGFVSGVPGNLAVFLRRAPGNAPGTLTLVRIDEARDKGSQEGDLNSAGSGGKALISYASILVQGTAENVAAFRG